MRPAFLNSDQSNAPTCRAEEAHIFQRQKCTNKERKTKGAMAGAAELFCGSFENDLLNFIPNIE